MAARKQLGFAKWNGLAVGVVASCLSALGCDIRMSVDGSDGSITVSTGGGGGGQSGSTSDASSAPAVASLVFLTQPAGAARAGAVFGTAPVVEARDSSGNPLQGVSVSLTPYMDPACSAHLGSGTLAGSAVTTGSLGQATFGGLAYDEVETVYLKAASGSASVCSSGSVAVLGSYSTTVLADSPAGYWRLGGTGTTASDSSGNGRHGTYVGSNTTVTSGILTASSANATTLPGSTASYVQTGYTQSSVTAYSVEAWVKLTVSTSARQMIFQNRGTGAGMSLTMYVESGRVYFVLDSNMIIIGVYSSSTVNDGSWHHVVGTWSAASGTRVETSQFKVYIDGQEAATSVISNSPTAYSPLTGLSQARIGNHSAWSRPYDGSIGEVAVYTSALPASRIEAHYTAAGY